MYVIVGVSHGGYGGVAAVLCAAAAVLRGSHVPVLPRQLHHVLLESAQNCAALRRNR